MDEPRSSPSKPPPSPWRDDGPNSVSAHERAARLEQENAELRAALEEARSSLRFVASAGAGSSASRSGVAGALGLGARLAVGAILAAIGLGLGIAVVRATHADHRPAGPILVEVAAPAAASPGGLSYESALVLTTDPHQDPGAPTLSDAALAAPIDLAKLMDACEAPRSMHLTLRLVVAQGRAAGVSVYTTPRVPTIAACIDRHVRALEWPAVPHPASLTTAI